MDKFAILTLKGLNLKRFKHEDDFRIAVDLLLKQGQEFIVLKYHSGTDTWYQPEVIK